MKFQRLSFSEFHLYSLGFSKMETKVQPWTRWWFQMFFKVDSSLYMEMFQFDSYFSDGWFKHQLCTVDPMSEYYC